MKEKNNGTNGMQHHGGSMGEVLEQTAPVVVVGPQSSHPSSELREDPKAVDHVRQRMNSHKESKRGFGHTPAGPDHKFGRR